MSSPPPPEGAPWDLPIDEVPFAFVDLEMTGLEAAKDRVVEVCVERVVNGEVVGRIDTLLQPDERAGGAAHIHGLDKDVLAGAPKFLEVKDEIRRLLDGAVLVAHGAIWDVQFLRMEFERAQDKIEIAHWVDTLNLSRRSFSFPSHSMDSLAKEFAIDRSQAHRAGPDVAALREVFRRCLAVLSPKSARDLWEVRIGDRVARAEIMTACEAAKLHGKPVVIRYRPSRKAQESFELVVTQIDSVSEPPLVTGYLVPSRGRRELRADRILSVTEPNSLA